MTETRSERTYARLVRLLPAGFRGRFGADLQELFRDQLRAARAAGDGAVVRLWRRTLPAFLRVLCLEHRDALRARLAFPRPPRRPGDSMLATLVADLRFAGRMIRKSPVFSLVAVLVIALGSGAVTTIYSAMNAVVLRPLPATTAGDRLISIDRRDSLDTGGISASSAYYRYLGRTAKTLSGVAAWSRVGLAVGTGTGAAAVYGNIVSGNYFSVLGVRPALGRFFRPDEDATPLGAPVLVVSHGFWTARLGADSAAVGRPVALNGRRYTLIGVAPPGFRGVFTPIRVDAWVPLAMQAELRPGRDLEEAPWLHLFARLRDGVTRGAARAELTALTVARARAGAEPEAYRGNTTIHASPLTGLPDDARAAFLGFTALLLGAAGLVLLIASVNVAAMLSARAVARRRELAVRTALGAGRGRLVRQLLTETLVLFLAGALGGIAVASFATAALERIPLPSPGDTPMILELSPDARVFGFAILLSLATGLIFGLTPALQGAGQDVNARLRDDTAGGGRRRSAWGNGMIVGQLALSLVLLVSAGLFLRALSFGAAIDPGFESAPVATASLNTEAWGYDEAKGRAFYHALHDRLGAIPGVTAVSAANYLPLTFSTNGLWVEVDGGPGRARASVGIVGPEYFAALGIPILGGRPIDRTDGAGAPHVAVVNQTFARRFWPDGSAIGRTFRSGDDRITIIGVARDAKYSSPGETTPALAYLPMEQAWRPDQFLLVRSTTEMPQVTAAIEAAVASIDPALPRPEVVPLARATGFGLFPQKVAAIVTGGLGTVGLLLATVGLYGVIAYSTGRRSREIGLRMALGADRRDVLRMILGDGVRLAGLGVGIGLLLAAAAGRLIAGLLLGVDALDAVTFLGVAAVLTGVALLASYFPARRAAALDTMAVLRTD